MIFNLCLWAKVLFMSKEMLERGIMNQAVLIEKQNTVNEIVSKIKDSQSTVIVEYRGLSVAEVTELRRNLRAEDVDFKVYKNTMAERAVDECGFDGLKEYLSGPNALAFSKDATAPARILSNFAKKHKALVLKSGIVEGKEVGLETLQELASLPNRDGMLSMLLGCLQSPVRSFACIVKAVADAKESGEFKVVDAPVEESNEAPVESEPAKEAEKEGE